MILIFTILTYSLTTLTDLIDRTNYINLEMKYKNKLDYSDFKFTPADGFAIAAGIQFYDPVDMKFKTQIRPEIGQIKFLIKEWYSQTTSMKLTELKQRKCEEKDFRVDNEQEKSSYGFYAFSSLDREVLNEELYCIDEPFEIAGNYNSN